LRLPNKVILCRKRFEENCREEQSHACCRFAGTEGNRQLTILFVPTADEIHEVLMEEPELRPALAAE